MKQQINDFLINRGYTMLSSSMPELTVFFRAEGDLIMSVMTLDCRGRVFQIPYYRELKNQVGRMFEAKGYSNIRVFTLFLVGNVSSGRMLGTSDALSWVIDTSGYRLCIFENEMEDFDNLRDGLEEVLRLSASDYGNPGVTVSRWIGGFFFKNKAPMTLTLILINILVYIVVSITGSTENVTHMIDHGALYPPFVLGDGQYYRLLTSIFLHFGIEHLFANMLSLWIFGEKVEAALGQRKFLFLYLISGLTGSACSLGTAYFTESVTASAGASGAIFGVIGALFAIVIKNRGRLGDITLSRGAFLIAYSVFSGFLEHGVDNAAHIGGLLTGLFLGAMLYTVNKAPKTENPG